MANWCIRCIAKAVSLSTPPLSKPCGGTRELPDTQKRQRPVPEDAGARRPDQYPPWFVPGFPPGLVGEELPPQATTLAPMSISITSTHIQRLMWIRAIVPTSFFVSFDHGYPHDLRGAVTVAWMLQKDEHEGGEAGESQQGAVGGADGWRAVLGDDDDAKHGGLCREPAGGPHVAPENAVGDTEREGVAEDEDGDGIEQRRVPATSAVGAPDCANGDDASEDDRHDDEAGDHAELPQEVILPEAVKRDERDAVADAGSGGVAG